MPRFVAGRPIHRRLSALLVASAAVAFLNASPAGAVPLTPIKTLHDTTPVASASGANGTQVVLTIEIGGRLMAAVRDPGQDWAAPVQVGPAPPNSDGLPTPKVAVDGAGNILVAYVWEDYVAVVERRSGVWSDMKVVARRSTYGDNPYHWASGPNDGGPLPQFDVAVSPAGQAVIVWDVERTRTWTCTDDGDYYCDEQTHRLRVATRAPGQTSWKSNVLIGGAVLRDHRAVAPSVGVDDDGRVTLAYLAFLSKKTEVEFCGDWHVKAVSISSAGITPAGLLDGAKVCDPDTIAFPSNPDVAVGAYGKRAVVWTSARARKPLNLPGELHFRVGAAVAGPADGLVAENPIDRRSIPEKPTTDDPTAFLHPQVAIDAGGDAALVVMHTHRNSVQDQGLPDHVLLARRAAGASGWAVSDPLTAVTGNTMPSVAVDAKGTPTASFYGYNASTGAESIGAHLGLPNSTGWGEEEVIALGSDVPASYYLRWPTLGPTTLEAADGTPGFAWSSGANTSVVREVRRAAIVSKTSTGGVVFNGGGGVMNRVTVDRYGADLRFRDANSPVSPGAGCTQGADAKTVRCPSAGVATVRIHTGDFDDRVEVLAGAGTLPVKIEGGDGDDTLIGGPGADTLLGENGADVLDGGGAADTLDGGAGESDRISYARRTAPVAIRLDGARNDGADPDASGASAAGEENDLDRNVENADGGSGADRLFGSTVANVLHGAAGDDRLDGGLGSDTLDGGEGSDWLSYAARTGPVVVKLDGLRNDGADPDHSGTSYNGEEADRDLRIENATGGSAADSLVAVTADAVINQLVGGAGDDTLITNDGTGTVDSVKCGDGTDKFRVDPSDSSTACETAL